MGYALSSGERILSLTGLLHPEVWRELKRVHSIPGVRLSRLTLATVLTSWFKAQKFGQFIRRLSKGGTEVRTFAYSYWANDMALAAAVARKKGWVEVALCRAHRWDVYYESNPAGFLPFREYLAENLDHFLFISTHGKAYFQERVVGKPFPSLGVSRLGTLNDSDETVARPKPFLLVSCSSLIPRKRVDGIVRAISRISGEIRWCHLGDGPERGLIEGLLDELPANVHGELAGHLANHEVLAYYRSARPSLFISLSGSEGIPVAMMEAMSFGIPVIGTDVGGVREIIRHGENGLLLSPDPSPGEVSDAIQWFLCLSEQAYRGYVWNARQTWEDRFNGEKNYRAFLGMITSGDAD